jgi:hypothetical protein
MQYLKNYQKKEIKFRIFSQISYFFVFFVKNETEKKKQQRHAYGKVNDI